MKGYYLKNCARSAAGVAVASLLSIAIIYIAVPYLNRVVDPPPGVFIETWLQGYSAAETSVWEWSIATVVLWHLLALWNPGRVGDLRPWWLGLYVASILGAALTARLQVPPAQTGQWWALIFALTIGVAAFWIGTVWCTPASSKYVPWGSRSLRRG